MSEIVTDPSQIEVGDTITEDGDPLSFRRWVVEEVLAGNEFKLRFFYNGKEDRRVSYTYRGQDVIHIHKSGEPNLTPIERKIRQMDERRKRLGYRW